MPSRIFGPNPRFETYFKKDQAWRAELNALRAILLSCGLDEELKWRQPCYTLQGNNIVILSSYKSGAALGFFKGALLPDPGQHLHVPGPNSKAARMLRFTSVEEIEQHADMITGFVKAAITVDQSGAKVDFSANKTVTYPDELRAAFNKNPALEKAFTSLTIGRQRGWLLQFSAAKQSATRTTRITKATPQILKGKGPHDAFKKPRPKA